MLGKKSKVCRVGIQISNPKVIQKFLVKNKMGYCNTKYAFYVANADLSARKPNEEKGDL